MRTTTADHYVSRARFSASDRPIPPDFDLAAVLGRRRARPAARDRSAAWSARLARWFEAFIARVAGVRRSASLALAVMLATEAARRSDETVAGAHS